MAMAWGTDVYFTRTMPSKVNADVLSISVHELCFNRPDMPVQGFDLLTDEFNYSLLLLTGLLLCIGCLWTARLVPEKDLSLAWA